jgi:hypothetical protein
MKYLFKIYAWQPVYTEVVTEAESEELALQKVKNLDSSKLDWKEHPLRVERVTYEVFTKSDQTTTK